MSNNGIYDELRRRAAISNDADTEPSIPEPGYLARTRKATMSAAVAFSGALASAAIAVTQDGVVTTTEVVTSLTIAIGVGLAAWFATWAVPNAK